MFIDRVKIRIQGGHGGNGVMAFRREKFVPRGGPSGGDGGRGGDIWIEADESLNTLLHLRYNPEHIAERGRHGEGSNRSGREGEDTTVRVPVGTQIFDAASDATAQGFYGARRALARRAAAGAAASATLTSRPRPTARRATTRRVVEGEERELQLELKLLADVGLVGFPNAGKSTLISTISAAKPKIADYPFTTLEPHLGVVDLGEFRTFVVADIPGLIEGAHKGAGLGDRFLRHVERTKLLLHLVDVSSLSGRDAVQDYETINRELAAYDARLAARPQIVVATKVDALDEPERLESLRRKAEAEGRPFYAISSATKQGVKELVSAVSRALDEIQDAETREEPDAETRRRGDAAILKSA